MLILLPFSKVDKIAADIFPLYKYVYVRYDLSAVADTPIEAQRVAVQCYINLQSYHVSLAAMLNADFIQELLNILQV